MQRGFIRNILIIPVGFEADRAKHTENNIKPDKCYLLTQTETQSETDLGRSHVSNVFSYFKSIGIETEVIGVSDFFDIYQLMSVIRILADQHYEDNIIINVGAGSKISGMAGMIISGMYENVSCYYPKRIVDQNQPETNNNIQGFMLPKFSIKPLEEEFLPVMNFLNLEINQKGATKKSILEHLIEQNHIQKFSGTKERTQQTLFNQLKRNYIDLMINEDLIEETNNLIRLTARGMQMLIIFGSNNLISEHINE